MPAFCDAARLQVAAVVTFYMVSALVMVFVNKAVLDSSPQLPLVFLMLQLLIAVVLLHVSAKITDKVKIPALDWQVAKKLVPVVSVNIIGLVFNTLCLRDVEASFFQIARGLVLPLTIVVSCTHTRTKPSKYVTLCAAIVTLGFMLGVAPSKDLPVHAIPSNLSLFYGVLSALFIAFHAVLIKSSLPHCNNSTIELAWWTNLGSAAMLLPFVFLHGEYGTLWELVASDTWNWRVFAWGSAVTGVFGFLLCVAGLLSIKVTSPITHMFSSAAKSVLQTVLGVWFFSDIITTFYTWIKSQEGAAKPPPPKRPADVELGSRANAAEEEREVLWQVNEKTEDRN